MISACSREVVKRPLRRRTTGFNRTKISRDFAIHRLPSGTQAGDYARYRSSPSIYATWHACLECVHRRIKSATCRRIRSISSSERGSKRGGQSSIRCRDRIYRYIRFRARDANANVDYAQWLFTHLRYTVNSSVVF